MNAIGALNAVNLFMVNGANPDADHDDLFECGNDKRQMVEGFWAS